MAEPLDSETSYEVLGPEDPPQFIYTNGFVDQNGLYFINGGSYELYDPYSGNVTVVVGPAPPYPGGGGPPPVLAAVPCNPLPLQPLEWFNPAFLSCVAAPCQPQCMGPPRGKRYSLDSQNCSPQSSESTGSPQEGEEAPMQFHPQAPPPYVYPGYMFGPPVYNMNGEYRLQVDTSAPPAVAALEGAQRLQEGSSRSISRSTRQRISFRGVVQDRYSGPPRQDNCDVTRVSYPSNDGKQPGVVELCNKTGRTLYGGPHSLPLVCANLSPSSPVYPSNGSSREPGSVWATVLHSLATSRGSLITRPDSVSQALLSYHPPGCSSAHVYEIKRGKLEGTYPHLQ
uniref:Uncharacterized protein n=1 Tax=Timema douglasi TaxID=61478 RepID=A0A7R8VWE4_TIMDO|nr:unnamed protein product [Timema douglasi]